jgi:hypothetical protein
VSGPAANARPLERLRASAPALLLAGAAVMLIGFLLRAPILSYAGLHDQVSFNKYLFQHLGSYSDIASLYFRDHLSGHPAPYFDYQFEYPVLTGAFVWFAGFVHGSVGGYFTFSVAMLAACGLFTIWLIRKFEEANPWLFALSPALALYAPLNWDLFALALTIFALLLYRQDRDSWAGAVLGLAVSAKFFPLLLLPLALEVRLLERRWRQAAVGAITFAVVTLAVNLPVAFEPGAQGGLVVRRAWTYFFEYNEQRKAGLNIWTNQSLFHVTPSQMNLLSGVALALGMIAIMYIITRRARPERLAILLSPAALAALAWFFFVNKVSSPQYSLWVFALLALAGAPIGLVVAFAVFDFGYFMISFVALRIGSGWFGSHVVQPASTIRDAFLFSIAGWALWRLSRLQARRSPSGQAIAAGGASPSSGRTLAQGGEALRGSAISGS